MIAFISRYTLVFFVALSCLASSSAMAVRLKNVAHVEGVRDNQLVGYGIVVGLDGTGDTRRVVFTQQAMAAMLSRVGIRVDPESFVIRNVAAVMVTASLPPFAQQGTKLDVVVSSAGDARSLVGGTLILTPLVGVDGQTYAMAQGPIHVGGYGSRGRSGSRLTKNHLNVGRIPEGALVERSVIASLEREGVLTLVLNKPDFSTMKAVVDAVNASLGGTLPAAVARHAGAVDIVIPEAARTRVPEFIAALEVLDVVPDTVARVVLNPRTGTIVVGSDVRISPIAIAHGGLKLEISETPDASQPQALAQGQTVVTSTSELRADEARGGMRVVQPGTTLSDLADALNALGVPPRDLVSILESIAAAGALHAQLEVL